MINRHARRNLSRIILLSVVLATMGCAAKLSKLAVCDGKHRREANPYGSVLPGAPLTAAPTSAAKSDPPSPSAPPPAAPKTSAIAPSGAFVRC